VEKARHYLKEIILVSLMRKINIYRALEFHRQWLLSELLFGTFGEDRQQLRPSQVCRGHLKPEKGENPLIKLNKGLILRNIWVGDYSVLIIDNGRMGLAAKIAQPRDEVSVFHGYLFPFLIRKAGEHYRLLGQCYIHGLIGGKAFKT
jgi:hypothetical protein